MLTVKIPQEILYWSLEDRKNFVRSMKVGNMSVFNGRAMVIGCARAGKTTLVKKIKGDKDLETTSTSGIEIHTHAFKLNSDDSTIIGKSVHFLYLRFVGYKYQAFSLKVLDCFVCLFFCITVKNVYSQAVF